MSKDQTRCRSLRRGLGLAAMMGGVLGAPALAGSGDSVAVAVIEIEGTPVERQAGPAWLGDATDTLLEYVETFDTVAIDDEFGGLVVRLKDASLRSSQIEELGAALSRVRAEGKKVHVFAENYGTQELLLGAYADEVIIQSGGGVSFPGLHMEEMFLADTLAWAGVKAELIQVGDYKGANEQMTRSEPSPAWNENIEGLLDSMYGGLRSILMEGRGLSGPELDEAMQVAWWADASQAIEVGLVDAEVDLPQLAAHLSEGYGADVEWVSDPYSIAHDSMDASNPFVMLQQLMAPPGPKRISGPTIAVLHVDGTIVDGDSTSGGPFGGAASVGSRTFRNAVEAIRREPNIKGVVVRIDSPGGSATASEVMWQGVQRLKEKKPVWVSVGSMAASGGYYVLSAGDVVYVNPSSIVGSIGVVGGKFTMGGLYGKLKMHVVERSRGPRAGMSSSVASWSDAEVELVRDRMKETYDLFAGRVRAGRPDVDLDRVGAGRLFAGRDAVGLKMADRLGGLDDAVNDLAADLGLTGVEIAHYPAPPSFEEMLEELFGSFMAAPGVARLPAGAGELEATLRVALGERRFAAVRDALQGLMLLRDEQVLLTLPRAVFFR